MTFLSMICLTAGSLKEFGRLLSTIEDERDRMVCDDDPLIVLLFLATRKNKSILDCFFCSQLERAHDTFIDPIEKFRREQIGGAKVS